MDDPNRERLKPVYPVAQDPSVKAVSTPYRRWTWAVRFLSAVSALAALALCGYFFIGFADNDQGIWHLLSAFALCFGTGLLAYGPLMAIAVWAHKTLKTDARASHPVLCLLFVLPWVIVAALLIPNGEKWVLGAVFIWVLSAVLLFWVALSFHQLKGMNARLTDE